MITLKNSDLQNVMIQIAGFNEKGQMVAGLLTENVSLGLKRRLQKIHQACLDAYKTLEADIKSVNEECKDDKEKDAKEIKELMDEEVTINQDRVSLAMIEAISTTQNYDFSVLEKISE